MPKLAEDQIQKIVAHLQAGDDLPSEYRELLFPLRPEPYDLAAPTSDSADADSKQTSNVLVVDDNESNRLLLSDYLNWEGYSVTVAGDGQEAIEKMRSTAYDLVLLDIMMPVMDGYETLETMRNDPGLRHLPVIVISAINDMDSVVRCIEMGAEDYLFKPFDAVLLRARISASLEKKHLRDQEQRYLHLLETEREKSERLLLNILPRPIANRLKQQETTIADNFTEVTVLFADIVDFTSFSAEVSPTQLVNILNDVFSAFDLLAERYNLEKIKTVGDAYMVVGGLPTPREDHVDAMADMALEMQALMPDFKRTDGEPFSMRIGMNTGPVVAGVIGTKKFIYDLWGDTVNMASRMESHGVPGQIQVTAAVYDRLSDRYKFEDRGLISVKGKGEIPAYLLLGRKG